jgi:hypothetical protein
MRGSGQSLPLICSKYLTRRHSMNEDTRRDLERLALERDQLKALLEVVYSKLNGAVVSAVAEGERPAHVARVIRVSRQAVHGMLKNR